MLGSRGQLIGNSLWWIKWLCDCWRHATLQNQGRGPNTLRVPVSRKQLEMLFSNNR